MLKLKETKAITLIALIVTIVVLLILAGVTIANVTGGDGIIEQASGQRDKTKISAEEQILGNAVISASDKFGEITENNLRQSLSNQNVEITKSGGLYRITFKDSNNLYKMNHDGEYFYWEDMAPTDIYAKKDGTTLYLRSTQPDTSYVKGEKWNDATITKVIIEEPIAPKTCYLMFSTFTNLKEIENIENLHTENVKSMYGMFFGCNKLTNLDISKFDTSNVTSMTYMFYDCQSIEKLNFSNFDTSNLESFDVVFYNCKKIKELNLTSINISKVNSLSNMFNSCTDLKKLNISNWDTALVQNMSQMFYNCKNLEELDLRSFDTNNVTNMVRMFAYCNELKKILVSNKFVTDKVLFEKIPNKPNGETYASYLFTGDYNLIGGAGTKYNPSCTSKTYARIDNPPTKPGYFTLK